MPRPFAITAASNSVFLDDQRQAETSFTVSNQSGREIEGRARLVAEEAEAESWMQLRGSAQRTFATAGTEQYMVEIEVPPDAPSGSYNFRLDMVGEERPDEQYVEGPAVTFEVPEPEPASEPFPWKVVAAIAAVLLIGGGVLAYVILSDTDEADTAVVPDVSELTVEEATASLNEAGFEQVERASEEHSETIAQDRVVRTEPSADEKVALDTDIGLIISLGPETLTMAEAKREAEEIAAQWIEAATEDVETFVELTSLPFYRGTEVLNSQSDVRTWAVDLAQSTREGAPPDSISAYTIAECRERGYQMWEDLLSLTQLSDDDLKVFAWSGGGEVTHIHFRRLSDRVELVGYWGALLYRLED